VLAGIAAILVALVVGTNRLGEWKRLQEQRRAAYVESLVSQVRPAEINPKAFDDYFREHTPFLGPVPLGDALTMTGDIGLMARLQVVRGNDAASYTVRIQNLGTKPFDGSFSNGGAWLDTDQGRFYPPEVQTLPIGTASPSAIGPDTEANLVLTFKIPAQAKPAGLVLSLRLGQYYPNAQWSIQR
jgi:hypothetical protein